MNTLNEKSQFKLLQISTMIRFLQKTGLKLIDNLFLLLIFKHKNIKKFKNLKERQARQKAAGYFKKKEKKNQEKEKKTKNNSLITYIQQIHTRETKLLVHNTYMKHPPVQTHTDDQSIHRISQRIEERTFNTQVEMSNIAQNFKMPVRQNVENWQSSSDQVFFFQTTGHLFLIKECLQPNHLSISSLLIAICSNVSSLRRFYFTHLSFQAR